MVFIIPYRDRSLERDKFQAQMKIVLEDIDPSIYEFYYAHQTDNRSFNRGAMKNIGFLAIKQKYPNDYKNITFIFNDVDTVPRTKGLIDYITKKGVKKHFFGFEFALGGIVSILGSDFESLNGFPNYWAWGFEDNLINWRADQNPNIKIDRSQFYKIGDPNILQIKGSIAREVNRSEFDRYTKKLNEGLNTIGNLHYTTNPSNGYISIDVLYFTTGISENMKKRQNYDLRNGPRPFINGPAAKRGASMRMNF
jgi:hypothetical protein